jgi:hypothetical protein
MVSLLEVDDQLDAGDAAVAELAARDVLNTLSGDWHVRVFWANDGDTYGVRVRRNGEGAVYMFGAGEVRERGFRSSVRIALRMALAQLGLAG